MTRDETKKLLMVIDACYPNFKSENITATINSWAVMLEEYDYRAIEAGLKVFVATSGSAFAPSVSELIAAARKPMELKEPDMAEDWTQVRKAIRDSYYHAEEHFDKLSDTAKKVVGTPSQLRSWGQMESREVDTVVWSNFKKCYESAQSRARELKAIPGSVMKVIEQTSVAMIEGEVNA